MKKPKSNIIFNKNDLPISKVRKTLMKGLGFDINELEKKPFIAIANSQTDFNPGHIHLNLLAKKVKEGINAAGGIPFEFNIPAPCDGIAEGHDGMRFILPQRELIADTIETYTRSMLFDGIIMIASCDKIIPGMLMAAARLNLPTIFLTGGPSAWQNRFNPNLTDKNFNTIATCGACELMGTANTLQCLVECMGMTLPGSANVPAFHTDKLIFARMSGMRIVKMVEENLTAKLILTEKTIENALIMDLAIGGSTNATLHLPAIASELGFCLPLKKFNEFNQIIPTLLAIKPNGPHGIIDLYAAGGILAVMKMLSSKLNLNLLTVTGKTVKEVLKKIEILDTSIIRSIDNPYQLQGGTAILFGNLAPEGAVIKQSAVKNEFKNFVGPAKVFNSEQEVLLGFRNNVIKEGQVIVIRNEGPKGGPGMPEMLSATLALKKLKLKKVALITDGRFSGATSGPCVGHVSPEAYVKGPIAALDDGDIIEIDILNRTINVRLSDNEIKKRLEEFIPPKKNIPKGFLNRYIKYVSSASKGAILE